MPDLLLVADDGSGNDPLEVGVTLPGVPRSGDKIEAWDPEGYHGGEAVWFVVEEVTWSTYEDGRIVVFVRLDGYDREQLRRVFDGIAAGVTP